MVKAALLFTGGKDSCLALLKAEEQGLSVEYLLSVLPSSYDSWMWHKPDVKLLEAQAKVLGIPLLVQKSKTVKEEEVEDLKRLFDKVKGRVEVVVTGGVASNYQRQRIEKVAEQAGLKVFSPLWGKKAKEVWGEAIKNNFKIVLTKVCCEGLGREWLGKLIDESKFKELRELSKKFGFSLEFEGGDAETAVLDMPLFSKIIGLESDVKSETDYRHFLIIKRIRLREKK